MKYLHTETQSSEVRSVRQARVTCRRLVPLLFLLTASPLLAQDSLPAAASAPGLSTDSGGASNPSPEDLSSRSVEWLVDEGTRAYEHGDYGRASMLYQAVVDRGAASGALHYNLGNAFLRQDALGEAIHHYRIAELLLPRDGDVDANLRTARDRGTKLEPLEPEGIRRLIFWYSFFSPNELMLLTGLGNVLFWGLLLLGKLRRGLELRLLVGLAGLFTLALGTTAVLKTRTLALTPDAVVLEPEVSIRSGTDVRSVALFTLKEGTEVRTQSVRDDWVQVEWEEGKRGWVERKWVGLVQP